ncbi:MAG: YfhO family protein, partial [Bacteroidales bacterium]|nr:YfhO family protein [Bacteroidales bacterium]
SCRMVSTPDEEINLINEIDPAGEAVINEEYQNLLSSFSFRHDSLRMIELVSYKANELIYSFRSAEKQMVVFSEIYYPKGWNAYLDGSPMEYFRANYILRAAILPAGEHDLIFRFEPQSYKMGNTVSLAGSILLILLLSVSVIMEIRKHGKKYDGPLR